MRNSFQIRAGRALENTYFREVMRCLYRIQKYLTRIQNGGEQRQYLIEITETSRQIADLAMIHGFDGVENVARKMISTFENLLRTNAGLHPALHSNVAAAIDTVQKIADIEAQIESELKIERAGRNNDRRRRKVQQTANEQRKSLDDLFCKQIALFDPIDSTHTESPDKIGCKAPEFDISEPEMVANCKSEG
jgi:hypothetical protein